MSKKSAKILMLVEGEKRDVRLMQKLLDIYEISANHTIVSYKTNIYMLYKEMFADGQPSDMDICGVLKSREKDIEKKKIFDERYTDIILVFDLDPQDPYFSPEKIKGMQEHFVESTKMGKLYINYPMVEAFWHMNEIPDDGYGEREVSKSDLKKYKNMVGKTRKYNYETFAVDKQECDIVISQNVKKGFFVASLDDDGRSPNLKKILDKQLTMLDKKCALYVLCTCVYYIVDYNPNLVNG